jgi:hypothetical protein
MDVVASLDETPRELGHEGLRSTPLRLSDLTDERGEDRYLHPAITL